MTGADDGHLKGEADDRGRGGGDPDGRPIAGAEEGETLTGDRSPGPMTVIAGEALGGPQEAR